MQRSFPGTPFVALLLFAISGFALYANSLDVPFYLDDLRNITENTNVRLRSLSFSALYDSAFHNPVSTRPVAYVSFALNYYFHKTDVSGYHLVNIGIHVLTSFFIFLLFRATLSTPSLASRYSHKSLISLFAAFLFLVHPLHTGSVTYIVQRMVSMATLFYILSLLCYVRGRLVSKGSAGYSLIWFSCSLFSFMLAIGSKEIAATLPFVIVLYEWYFFQDLDKKWVYRKLWIAGLLFLTAALIFYVTGGIQEFIVEGYKNRPFTPIQRVLTQFRVVLLYIGLILFPHPERLNLDHYIPVSHSLVDPVTTLFAAALLAMLLCVSVFTAKKQRILSFAILWYLGNLIIESSFIGLELIFEHRTYLPSVFFLFALVSLIFQYIRPAWLVYAVFIIIAGLWSYWTVERNEVWRDPAVFWSDSAAKSPRKARPLINLSVALREKGDIDGAIAASRKAIAIDPRFVNGFVALAAAYDAKGELEKAAELYREAIQLLPEYGEVYNALGIVYLKQGRIDLATAAFDENLRLDPDNVNTLVNRAAIKASSGDFKGAESDFILALKTGGRNPDILFNLALAYLKYGQSDKAIETLEEVLRLNPEDIEARNTLESLRSQR